MAGSIGWRTFGSRVFDKGQALYTGAHSLIYRMTGGKAGRFYRGGNILFLVTVGRKSGKARTTPLLYIRDDERFVIAASNAGAPRHPMWWMNLRDQPEATVEIERRKVRVRAEEASEEEKKRLWPKLVEMYAGFEGYQEKTERIIPVLILTPIQP